MIGVEIQLIPPTAKTWPKSPSIAAMPEYDRYLLAEYLTLIHPGCPLGTDEGLFGATNILHRAGLTWADLARCVYDETDSKRVIN